MKHYAVVFLPGDIWVSSYEQALRYLPVDCKFDGLYTSDQEVQHIINTDNDKKNVLIYSIETEDISELQFNDTTRIDCISFVPQKNKWFTYADLNRDLDCFCNNVTLHAPKERLRLDDTVNYPGVKPWYADAVLDLSSKLFLLQVGENPFRLPSSVLNALFKEGTEASFEKWSRQSVEGVNEPVMVYQKYQALTSMRQQFTYICDDQTPWNKDYFSKKNAFIQCYSRLAKAADLLNFGEAKGVRYQQLQLRLYTLLRTVEKMRQEAQKYSVYAYYNDRIDERLPKNAYLGLLPTLTRVMELVSKHLNINEHGVILKLGTSSAEYQQEIATLKRQALKLQGTLSYTLECLSYLMFSISACAVGVTLASIVSPIGFVVAAGSLLAGIGLFKVAEADSGRQVVVAMNGISNDLEKYIPPHLSAGH